MSAKLSRLLPANLAPYGTDCDNRYFTMSGTSMAAAMTSGAAVMMLFKDLRLNPATIKARLMRSATKIAGDPTSVGAGVLNITAALNDKGFVSGQALSPVMVRSDVTGLIQVQDTAMLWGDSTWGAGYPWANCYLWANVAASSAGATTESAGAAMSSVL